MDATDLTARRTGYFVPAAGTGAVVRDRIAVVRRIGAEVPAAQKIDGKGLATAPAPASVAAGC